MRASVCKTPGCDLPVYVEKWGLCRPEYNRLRREGVIKRPPKKLCRFEGCERDAVGKGLCNAHLSQEKRGRELAPLKKYRAPKEPASDQKLTRVCDVPVRSKNWEPCGEPAGRHSLCRAHMTVYAELVRA